MALRLRIGTTDYRAGNLPQRIQVRGGAGAGISTLRCDWNLKDTDNPIAGGQPALDNAAVWFGPTTVGSDTNKPIFTGNLTLPRAKPYQGGQASRFQPTAKGKDHAIRRRLIPPNPVTLGLPAMVAYDTHAAVVESFRAAYLSDVVTSVEGLDATTRVRADFRRGSLASNFDAFGTLIGATWRVRPDGVMTWTYASATTVDLTLTAGDIQAAEDSVVEGEYANSIYAYVEDDQQVVQLHAKDEAEIARVGQVDRIERVSFESSMPALWGTLRDDPDRAGDDKVITGGRRMAYDPDNDWLWFVNNGYRIWAIRLSDMRQQVSIRFAGNIVSLADSGSIAVSGNRIYHSILEGALDTRAYRVFAKPAASATEISTNTIRVADEDFTGQRNAGMFYDRTGNRLWALTRRGGGTRTWRIETYDFATFTWSDEFTLPDTRSDSYTGLVVTRDSVLMGRIANPGSVIQHDRHTGEFVRSYEAPLQHATGLAGDVASARIFYRFDTDKVGYFRALTPGDHLQRHADALLARHARTVRRLSLTLKPRDNLLPLPYASIVALPAGT